MRCFIRWRAGFRPGTPRAAPGRHHHSGRADRYGYLRRAQYAGHPERADRLIEAPRWPLAIERPVLFTGGARNLISTDAKEADYAAEIFASLGIPKTRLIMERLSATL